MLILKYNYILHITLQFTHQIILSFYKFICIYSIVYNSIYENMLHISLHKHSE